MRTRRVHRHRAPRSAHRDFTAEVDALRCTSSRTAAHERGALAEAQAELTRLRLDASGQRGRIAALQAEATKLRAQLGAAETKAADAASSGASAAEAAAKFEVQARTVGEELTALKAQLARAHADGDGRARQLAEATSSLERERASLEALERRAEREAQVLQAKLDDASAELSRREQRCAHLQQQLEGALGEGREARAAVEAARRHGAGEGAAHAIELRTLGAELAVLETSCARVDERVATQVEQESAKAAAATARAEHEAAHKTAVRSRARRRGSGAARAAARVLPPSAHSAVRAPSACSVRPPPARARAQALESQLAKTSAQLKVAERKLGEATHRLGAAQRHGTQLRAAQEQLAELRAALDKKTALCERLLKRQSAFHPAAPSAHADAGPDDDGRTGPRGASLGGGGGKENARSDGLPSPRLAEQPRSAHARSGPLRRPNFAAPSSSTAKGAAPAARTAFRSRPALRPGGAASAPSTPKRETRSPASARPAPSPRLEVSTGNDSPCHGGSEQDAAAPDLDCASEASLGAAGPRPRRKSGVKVVPSRYMESALAASSNRRRSSGAGLAA